MIQVDESDPIDDVTPEPALPQRDVTIKRGKDANEYYELIEEIGRGKFGTVYNCREKSTGLKLAAKNIPIPKRDDRRNVEREVEIMNSLQHPKIIQLYDAYEYNKNMWVILELIEGGELFERVIDDNYLLTEKACIVIIRQVCEAMEFVHRNSILHLDLKPENILCTTREGNRIKIIDFGLARKYDPDKKLQVLFGTPEFVAPEVVNFDTISFGTDIWSVGVICYVLLSGLSPFMGETDIETMTNVTVSKYDFDDEAFNDISPEAINFISKLLIKDINERMTAAECLDHKWLKRRTCLRPQLAPKPIILPPPKFKPIITESLPIITSPILTPVPSILSPILTPITSPLIQTIEYPMTPTILLPNTKDIEYKLDNDILDKTKENLKEFVQRWGENRNSPYIFDRENNYISPPIQLELNANSNLSSRGCSPSPCESITNTNGPDIVNIEEENNNQNTNNDSNSINSDNNDVLNNVNSNDSNDNSNKNNDNNINPDNNLEHNDNIQSENQSNNNSESFDRPSSESNCETVTKQDKPYKYDQISLADEIKKLSERLLMLSQMNIDVGIKADINHTPIHSNGIDKSYIENNDLNDVSCNDKQKEEIPEVPKDILKPELMKKPEVYKSKLNEAYNRKVQLPNETLKQSIFRSMRSNSSSFDKLEENYLSDLSERSETIHFNGRSFNTANTNSSSSITNENYFNRRSLTTSSRDSIFSQINGNDLTNSTKSPVWASSLNSSPSIRRTKFRINHASRDVPLAPTHHYQSKSMLIEDSARTTNDCLLRLLDKYDRNGSSNTSSSNFFKSSKLSTSSSSASTIASSLNCSNTFGRHKSISVDWGISDNLENHTMNSINSFFHRNGNRANGCVKKIQTQIESRK